MPLVPSRAPMPSTRTCLGPLCPSFIYILGTSLKSARFHIPEGVWGQVPLAPHGRPCPPPENALVPCAPLFQNFICWLHHCNQQLRELRNNWHLRATLHQVFVTSNISTVTHSIVARIVCHAEVICFAKKPSCRKSFVFVNES